VNIADYIQFLPQVQAAFATQGITISLVQIEGIVAELLPLFSTPPAPVVLPVSGTQGMQDSQLTSVGMQLLGRPLTVNIWQNDPNYMQDIANSPEAIAFAARSKGVVLTGNWGGVDDPRFPGLRAALVSGLTGEAAVNAAGLGYAFEPDKNVYAVPVPPGGYILVNGQGGYDYAPGG
jgi:hypothetical protein